MIIIGLGTNRGDTMQTLLDALAAINKIPETKITQISPLYASQALLLADSPDEWKQPYINAAVCCQSHLQPKEFLHELKKIESAMGRDLNAPKWSPRVIDLDILTWDEKEVKDSQLTIPHAELLARPFALWPLADLDPFWVHPTAQLTAAELVEKWGSRFDGSAPFQTHQVAQRLAKPHLLGILNVTPNSFSDGNLYLEPSKAYERAMEMIADGVHIIDIGAESTAPNAKPLSQAEEWQRLEPLIQPLIAAKKSLRLPPKICIDTHHPATARKAIALGVDWINDVSGLDNPEMIQVIYESGVKVVVMHHLAIPENRNVVMNRRHNPVETVMHWARERLAHLHEAGISESQIIFDPGIGFGKLAEQSFAILKNAALFKQLNVPILIGHSRKTFLSSFTRKTFAERDIETFAVSLQLAQLDIDYLRIHNVAMTVQGLRVLFPHL